MTERWKVRYLLNDNEYSDCVCDEVGGQGRKNCVVDMLVDGAFPEGTTSKSLVGKIIECDYTHAGTLIAAAPRIADAA